MFMFGRLKVQGSRQCLSLADLGFKVHDNGYLAELSHQGQRERLLTYVCRLHYTVPKYCEFVVGFVQGKLWSGYSQVRLGCGKSIGWGIPRVMW